jgi:hypothetical protein
LVGYYDKQSIVATLATVLDRPQGLTAIADPIETSISLTAVKIFSHLQFHSVLDEINKKIVRAKR